MAELVAYGTYVPYWRRERAAIRATLGSGGGRGTRAVASYDEDSTSMGVEASRIALRAAPDGYVPDVILLATASPAYQDKTNAGIVHAALALPEATAAYDFAGAPRSSAGALRLARTSSLASLVIASDVRTGLPGSSDEAEGGDAAVAFAYSPDGPALVEVLGEASSSGEFLDRWRLPGARTSRVWEERFGESAYEPLARTAFTDALKRAGITSDDVDHLVVSSLHARAARALVAWSGVPESRVADDRAATIGNPGGVQAGLLLADVLDRAEPGAVIVVAHLADGADVVVYRVTPALTDYRDRRTTTVAAAVERGRVGLPYAQFLSWRGLLDREPPRRPDPKAPAGPPSLRNDAWKFSYAGSRCEACGRLHLPPVRVCLQCGAVDRMASERLADVAGTIATYTIDRLAYSPSPPLIGAVVDYDGGGRNSRVELTDVDADEVAIGGRVAMTFRRLYTSNGIHNYFWKGRLVREGE